MATERKERPDASTQLHRVLQYLLTAAVCTLGWLIPDTLNDIRGDISEIKKDSKETSRDINAVQVDVATLKVDVAHILKDRQTPTPP